MSEHEAIKIITENSCCTLQDENEKARWVEAIDLALSAGARLEAQWAGAHALEIFEQNHEQMDEGRCVEWL